MTTIFNDQINIAKNAYNDIVLCYSLGKEASKVLFSNEDTSSLLRGVLLGRPSGEGATVSDLLVCRLQHDIGYLPTSVKIDTFDIPPLRTMTNNKICNQLSLFMTSLLMAYSPMEQLNIFTWNNGGQQGGPSSLL